MHEVNLSGSRVIVIGASAGGLKAISTVLSGLTDDFPAPIVIVQHLSPEFPSKMAHILNRSTALRVQEAQEGDSLEPGHVYIAPPGKHVLVNATRSLSLSLSDKIHHVRPSVDVLFCSAAANCGKHVIGIVLTGGDGDGSAGIRAIKAAGGVTIAQNEQSSEHPSMPRSAVATGDVDFVLPLSEIAGLLVTLLSPSATE